MSNNKGKVMEKDIGSREQFEERVKQLQLSDDTLIGVYRTMCTVRHFEYMADKLYAAGKVHGTMHLSAGQEAV
jgi:TPP-dependent pyruvate/acetoin dehydrogenase alpha subunit